MDKMILAALNKMCDGLEKMVKALERARLGREIRMMIEDEADPNREPFPHELPHEEQMREWQRWMDEVDRECPGETVLHPQAIRARRWLRHVTHLRRRRRRFF